MKVFVAIFGGLDINLVEQYDCKNLKQQEYGKVIVDELWNNRDVATQITSQLISGETWRKSGIKGRKKYTNELINRLEKDFFRKHGRRFPYERKTRHLREAFYSTFNKFKFQKRNYVRDDFLVPTIFDKIENAKAVYVPSYNPEPSWALDRNILDPRKFPEFGLDGALDLLNKNFFWRKKRLLSESNKSYQLLMSQFQYIDSLQHLFIVYHPDKEKIEKGYHYIDNFAAELKKKFSHYDLFLFISDNGAAQEKIGATHHNRPFYSISKKMGITKRNIRDFYQHMINWIKLSPNSGVIK